MGLKTVNRQFLNSYRYIANLTKAYDAEARYPKVAFYPAHEDFLFVSFAQISLAADISGTNRQLIADRVDANVMGYDLKMTYGQTILQRYEGHSYFPLFPYILFFVYIDRGTITTSRFSRIKLFTLNCRFRNLASFLHHYEGHKYFPLVLY